MQVLTGLVTLFSVQLSNKFGISVSSGVQKLLNVYLTVLILRLVERNHGRAT